MTQEVIVRLRDDFDQSLDTEDDRVETRTIAIGDDVFELELIGANYELLLGDLKRWLAVARPVRKRRKKKATQEARPPRRGQVGWNMEIHTWAAEHGYNWADPAVRREVRAWSAKHLGKPCPTGIIPRSVMEAHYKYKQLGGE